MEISLRELESFIAGAFGLLIGSFLNVVIHRLPKMMERAWIAECAEYAQRPVPENDSFNLMVPRSRCPHCGHAIRWHENIPVLSYLFLGGRCSACKAAISMRYPIVELATGSLFFYCIWRWGATPTGVTWCVFSAILLSLALIDWDTTLLPDDLTLPLLWLGLISATVHWTQVDLHSAVWGAVAGYMSLWSVYWLFKLVTGKEGMGYGDFKLFAALGAWFGWQALIPMILLASVIGAAVGITMKLSTGLREGGYVPFGPFLSGAGLTALLAGPAALQKAVGL
ncbi:MAG: prepilin peptidase [Burkholderiales bacterium]|jgi:leader peptidase (prepilin peptidase)/N-methyltransferase|nr:prepilin peptidase [Burkholderiales bacterium]MBK9345956.1 prepilin peptidase [Burkholderiales bacterium]